MANYFQDPSQSFVPSAMYKPNFDALQMSLMTSQSKYDAGLAGVQSAYNSVLNAPLTKNENADVRQQYIKDATKQLQDLGGVDLSIESNQLQARGVFNNFFNDHEMQTDMVNTKAQGREMNLSQSFKPEKDSNQYVDGRNTANMNSAIERVRNGKRGDMSVYGVQKFVPYTDLSREMSDVAIANKFAVEKVTDKGIVTVKNTNGVGSRGNWATYIDAMMGDRYNDQLRDEATYAKLQGIKREQYNYGLTHNGEVMNEQAALSQYVQDTYKDSFKANNDIANQYTADIATTKVERDKYKDNKDNQSLPLYKKTLDEYKAHIEGLEKGKIPYAGAAIAFTPGSAEYNKSLNEYLSNPDGQLFKQIRGQHIQMIAAGLSANEKTDAPVANATMVEANKIQMEVARNDRENEASKDKHIIDTQKAAGLYREDGSLPAVGGTGRKNADGTLMTTAQLAVAGLEELHLQAQDNAGKTITITPTEKFNSEQDRLLQQGYQSLLDPSGMAGFLTTASDGNITYPEIVTYMSALNGDRKLSSYSKEELVIKQKVDNLFAKNDIKIDGTDRFAIGQGIHQLIGQHVTKNMGTEKWASENLQNMHHDDVLSMDALGKYNLNNANKQAKIASYVSDPDNKKIVTDRNGKKDFITADDISKDVNDIEITEGGLHGKNILRTLGIGLTNGKSLPFMGVPDWAKESKKEIISSAQLGKAYLKGDVKIKQFDTPAEGGYEGNRGVNLTINGKTYEISGNQYDEYGKPNNIQSYNQLMTIKNKYGDSADLAKKFKDIADKAIASVDGFSTTSTMGNLYNMSFDPKKGGGERAIRLINQVTAPGAHENYYVDGNLDKDEGNVMGDLFTKISKWGPHEVYKYMNHPQFKTQGSDGGKPSVVLSFLPMSDTEMKTLGIDKTLADKLTKGVELPLQDNNAPEVKKLINSSNSLGQYIYGKLTKGENIDASEMDKAVDFGYTITPNSRINPTYAMVQINRKQMGSDGQMHPVPSAPIRFNFSEHNPDEIVGYVRSLQGEHVSNNINIKTAYDAWAREQTDLLKSNLEYKQKFENENSL